LGIGYGLGMDMDISTQPIPKTFFGYKISITLIDEYYDRVRVRLGYLTWYGLG